MQAAESGVCQAAEVPVAADVLCIRVSLVLGAAVLAKEAAFDLVDGQVTEVAVAVVDAAAVVVLVVVAGEVLGVGGFEGVATVGAADGLGCVGVVAEIGDAMLVDGTAGVADHERVGDSWGAYVVPALLLFVALRCSSCQIVDM